jgi:hypothetical protein
VVGNCECDNEPSGFMKCGEFLDWLKNASFSRRALLHGVSMYVSDSEGSGCRLTEALLCQLSAGKENHKKKIRVDDSFEA